MRSWSGGRSRTGKEAEAVRINLASVLVDDQDKALRFYSEVLGFVKKTDVPLGEARWLTLVSPEQPDGTELLLEPDGHPAARPFKRALVDDGIPYTPVRHASRRPRSVSLVAASPPSATGSRESGPTKSRLPMKAVLRRRSPKAVATRPLH
jgi:catechol 2,3-dioxygenase-like lactoylglutathione lyase family enzyme